MLLHVCLCFILKNLVFIPNYWDISIIYLKNGHSINLKKKQYFCLFVYFLSFIHSLACMFMSIVFKLKLLSSTFQKTDIFILVSFNTLLLLILLSKSSETGFLIDMIYRYDLLYTIPFRILSFWKYVFLLQHMQFLKKNHHEVLGRDVLHYSHHRSFDAFSFWEQTLRRTYCCLTVHLLQQVQYFYQKFLQMLGELDFHLFFKFISVFDMNDYGSMTHILSKNTALQMCFLLTTSHITCTFKSQKK